MKMLNRGNLLFCSASLLFMPTAVAAQDNGEEIESESEVLQEIVVTAQKRADNLQTVPVAVTAITAAEIRDLRVNDAEDILSLTPGATFDSGAPTEQVISIRGIASGNEGASSDSGVLMMIDGEVISRDFMRTAAFFDTARIEVLRGPQGTTYGRNSTGGVFHVINNTPTEDFKASFRFDAGNFNLFEGEGFVSGPLSDSVQARLSFYAASRDGYTRDVIRNVDIDHNKIVALRGQLRFSTGDDSSVLLRAHYSSEDIGATPRKLYDATIPYRGPGGLTFVEPSLNPFRVANSPVDGFSREIFGASVEYQWAGDSIDLFSLTALRRGDATFDQDLFGTNIGVIRQSGLEGATTINHETRLSNAPSQGAAQWMLGLFFLSEDSERPETKRILPTFRGGLLSTVQNFEQTNKTDSLGIFGQLGYAISDQTKVEAGLRYSYDKKRFTINHSATGRLANVFLDQPPGPVQANSSEEWSNVSWKLSAQHEFSRDIFFFANVSSGYKAGGFNPEPSNLIAAVTPFDEETVRSYEIGLKTQLFDNALRFNVAGFINKFDDIQAEFFTPAGSTIIANVASAKIAGVEVDSMWQASRHLLFSVSAALYDHEYDKFVDTSGNDNSGNPIANVPDWTITTSVVADIPIPTNLGSLRTRVDFRTRSDITVDADTDRVFGIRQGKEKLGARLTWTSANDRYEIAIWGQNLLNKAEMVSISPYGGFNQRMVAYSAPRTFGVSLTAKFGS